MHVDDRPLLPEIEEEFDKLVSEVRGLNRGWDESHVVSLPLYHAIAHQFFATLPTEFSVNIVGWIFGGDDVVEKSHGPFIFYKLSEGLEDFVAQTTTAKGKQDFDIDQVIARDRLSEVDHVEIAKNFPLFRMDLEGVKRLTAFPRPETFNLRSMDGPVR
jgi:hypothetical protein